MNAQFLEYLEQANQGMKQAGTFKTERVIDTMQGTLVKLADGKELLNMCANNYLGLAQHPAVQAAVWRRFDLFVARKRSIKN